MLIDIIYNLVLYNPTKQFNCLSLFSVYSSMVISNLLLLQKGSNFFFNAFETYMIIYIELDIQ